MEQEHNLAVLIPKMQEHLKEIIITRLLFFGFQFRFVITLLSFPLNLRYSKLIIQWQPLTICLQISGVVKS